MSSARNPGRVAGFWYLLLVVLGPLRLIYIPNKLFVPGNATATVNNITAHEWLFGFGIASDLVCGVVLVLLVLAFYRLFKGVEPHLSVLVVILGGVMPALLHFVNVVSDAGALTVARGPSLLTAFDKPQREALVILLLRLQTFSAPRRRCSRVHGSSHWRSSCTGRAFCRDSWAFGSASAGSPS